MFSTKMIGERFGVIAELGGGGFGQTFLAEDSFLPEKPKCVIKQLKTASKDEKFVEVARRLFVQEAQILSKLGNHPQIPSLIAHFEENGEFYLVQEYIEGETLEEQLLRGRIYKQSEVIELTRQLLEILSFVHSQGVIHRDIKPSNIINRSSDGKLVLIDFGSVKQVRDQHPNPHLQTHTVAIGSNGYMPPEQLAGQPRFCSDLYAAGMLAIQLLTQTHPTHFVQNQRTGEWIWLDKANVNPHLSGLLNQMIRFDFRQRFSSAIEALAAFQRLGLYTSVNAAVSQTQHGQFYNQSVTRPAPQKFNQQNSYNPTAQLEFQKTGYAPPPELQQRPFQTKAVQPKQFVNPIVPNNLPAENQILPVAHPTESKSPPPVRKTEEPSSLARFNEIINESVFYKTIMYLFIIGLIFWFCTWMVQEAVDVRNYQITR